MLKITTKQVISINEWDRFVSETYGRPYSFQQQDECRDRQTYYISVPSTADDFKNDSLPEEVNGSIRGVSFAAWLARDPKQWAEEYSPYFSRGDSLELFWLRNFYPHIDMIANDLHAKGLLPAGEYGIYIDW